MNGVWLAEQLSVIYLVILLNRGSERHPVRHTGDHSQDNHIDQVDVETRIFKPGCFLSVLKQVSWTEVHGASLKCFRVATDTIATW